MEQKNYILHSLKTLLNLEEAPYELANSAALDKFLANADQESLMISALPTKEYKVLSPSASQPNQGTIIQITKFKSDSALKNFYSFNVRAAQGYQQLAKNITHLYEPIAMRTKNPALMQLKELKAVLENQFKRKFAGETDLSFTSFEEELDFWQELDIEGSTPRCSFFLKEYAIISKAWRGSRGGVELNRLSTLIQTTWSVMFNIWNSPHDYNQKRFVKLVQVFQGEVKNSIRMAFSKQSDLLEATFDIRQMIIESLQCCTRFLALLAYHSECARRKMPLIKTKIIEELKDKIMATYRTKSKVEFLLKQFNEKLLTDDPASLMFLVKAENFMSSFVSQFKNNPKAVQKLQKEKEKLSALTAAILPVFEGQLKECIEKSNIQYLVKTLEKWYYFLEEPQFAEKTVEYQDSSLKKSMEFLEKYYSDQNKLIEARASQPEKLRLLKAVVKKFDDINTLMKAFAENSTSMPAYRKKYDKIYEQLKTLEASTVKKFTARIEGELTSMDSGKLLGKVVLELSIGEKGMQYDTGLDCRKFIQETGAMIELGYAAKLGDKILKPYEQAKKFHKDNSFISSIKSQYNWLQGKLQFFQKHMLQKELKEIKEVIENPRIKKKLSAKSYEWRDLDQMNEFINKLNTTVEKMTTYLKLFNASQSQIEEISLELLSIDFNPNNFFVISQKLQQIARIIQVAASNRDSALWRQHWKTKLTEVIEVIWQQALIKGVDIPMTVRTVLVAKKPTFEPELYEIKEKYYKQLKHFIGWPLEQKVLAGSSLLESSNQLIVDIYIKTEEKFKQLEESLGKYGHFQKMIGLDLDHLQQKMGKEDVSSEQLVKLLSDLKESKLQVQNMKGQEKIHSFSIDNQLLKQNLSDLLNLNIEGIINLIKYSIKLESQQVEEYISNVMGKLQSKPKNMQEMAEVIKDFDKIKDSQKDILEKIKRIQQKNMNIRSITGASFNTANMLKRWQNFQIASVEMNNILQEQKNKIQEDTVRKSQLLENQANKIYRKYEQIKPKSQELNRQEVLDVYGKIKDWQTEWNEVQERFKTIESDIRHFNMKMPEFKVYKNIKKKLEAELGNWIFFMIYRAQVEKYEKEEWLTFRGSLNKYVDLINDFVNKSKSLVNMDQIAKFIREVLEDNKQAVPLLRCITGQNFEKEHWGMLFSILKIKNVTSADKLTFGTLLEADLLGKANELRELEARSRGEMNIRVAIDDLQAWSITREFQLTEYNSMGRVTSLIKEWKDVMSEVSDHQALVNSVKQNKYATRFKSQIEKYQLKFSILDAALLKLNQIQRKWIYLEPIFMRGALPQEQGRWKRLDEDYRNIMNNIGINHHVIELANIAGFIDTLNTIMAQLERCQKALNDFLEEKRNKFPRFYFLGDDDMLEILGQSQNPTIIQLHLKKLFSGIHTVVFGERNEKILAMRSHLKEEVRLSEEIQVGEVVENWLEELNKNMVTTLKKQASSIKRHNIEETFSNYCSQIICLYNELTFNAKCTIAMKDGRSSLETFKKEYQTLLGNLTKKCHMTNDQLVLAKIKSLILDIIHQIAVIDALIAGNTALPSDWNWHKQLRFSEEQSGIKLNMANSTFDYTFQYQGNAQKLVYTPLTDKCYLTLTQAMHMGLGGNPYGPAGTGKTESVKALALAFGRQVLVFNCDEGLDFQSMGRIFIGLVKCGAWGCFDEFNRLLEEQLSAISQQIQIIQEAIKAKEQVINLLGKKVEVNFNSGIFVTLNPAGKGYGGRSKLPDNLKQLFRPVAMSVPDNELIAEVLLFSEGFKTAKVLAQKIITIFTLSKQLLSKQLHYDWGLRALKTILTVAGRLVFEEKDNISNAVESEILIKALRINTISKLTFTDMLKFNVLVQDVFPGTSIKDIIYEQVSSAIQKVFQEENFQILPNQLNKILQFYEATKQRIGAVLVGPSGCGKTTIWKTLKKAYEKLKQTVKIHLINPKAMPRSSFLGFMNNDTREFSQGVLTVSARQVIKQDQNVLNWIICDGDVDPEWIQALNSVLDDNHLLTLPTGQRISFGSNVNFIFQTDNLQFASPATVSRMGMIYMNDEDININSIILKWTKKLKPPQVFIKQQISYVEEICNKIWKENEKMLVATTKVGLVRNALSLIEESANEQEFKLNLVKGLASNFDLQTRGVIFQAVFGKGVPGNRDPLSLRINNEKIIQYKDDEFTGIQRIYPTKEIKKDIDIVSRWLRANNSLIIVGKQGCGKSLLLQASIQQLDKSQKCKIVTLHCNRQSKANLIIQKLYQTCLKATSANGKILKPLNCSRQIFVLKEVNLPKPDKYNTIQLITFLQSLISHEGFYDHNLQFVRIGQGIQFVCIIKPSSTIGRFQITTRFVSNLRVLSIDYDSMGTKQKLDLLTPHASTIDQRLSLFWKCIHQNFQSDDNAHYLFCPRNLNSMVDNLEHYQIDVKKLDEVLLAMRNEAVKQFQDRLVDLQSKAKFQKLVEPIFGSNKSQLVFILVEGKLKAVPKSQYYQILQKSIKGYESDVKDVNIILVDEVITLMSSIQRKIAERGALLFAGMTGSLRKTSLRIIAYRHKIPIFTLSNLRNPSLKEFYKDLKVALEVAAGQNKQIILFLEEHQLGKNQFYEKINSLISSGQISGLFNPDEIEGITQDAQALKSQYFGKTLYESFIERIKKNVLIVVSLDHRNKQFYEICSANPAFYSQCRIIWLNCYSKQTMKQIFQAKTKGLNLKEIKQINEALVTIHEGSSHKYMNLIDNFLAIFEKTQSKSGNKLDKLTLGLKKLVETAKMVDSLTIQATNKKKLLTVKQKQADESLNYITDAMQQASSSKAQAQKLQSFLEIEQRKIERDRKIVRAQLQKVLPLIEEARVAVSGLTSKNIQQIRSFMNPPEAVRYVLKAVLALFGSKDDNSWNSMKNFLKVCKDQILVFDIKQVTQRVRNEVEGIISEHAFFFQRENVFKASQDAVPLADWVKAAVQYSKTYEKVRPLQENLIKIEKELERSNIRYRECTKKVSQSEQKIRELNENFVKKTNQAEVLKEELKKAETAQASGQQLLSKLQDEKVRWGVESDKLKVQVEMMPKYAAITACFVTYLSQSPQNIRHLTIEKWKKILGCHYFNFLAFVTNQAITLQQVMKGLPNDQLSIQNSQILTFLKNISVIIDPHTQATNWLKQKIQTQNKVETLTQQDPKFLNTLQLAIRFGKTLIIQQIDYIEPVLTPIIKGDYSRQGARNLMQIGDKSLDVNETFRLYLTTRNSSIEIAKHQKDLVSIVNFSVTKSGLEGKLLSIIITYFQPEIEKEKQELLEEQEKLKINLSTLEEKLLKELADSSGNILENKGLIQSLNETKAQSQVVTKSLKESQKLQRTLDEKREVYQIVAEIGAKLYISLSVLKSLNPMYKYNLSQFIILFQQSLDRGKKNSQDQIQVIKDSLIQIVFNNISVGLIKSHRLLLGLILVKQIYENSITQEEFNVLVGNVVTTENVQLPSWMQEKDKEKYKIFQSVVHSKENFNSPAWKEWHSSHQSQNHIPKDTTLTPFQTCLLSNVCRSDRLINTLSNFVLDTLKLPNLSGLEVNMKTLIEEKMRNTVPCIFIVSIGFDPSKEIQEYATKVVGKQRFQELSMGGDQNQYALQLLREAAKQGKWLCLKNLHLVISFVSILEKEVLSMEPHENFRLFLTTQAHEKFPPILLQTCFKISYEAPPGIKQNFTRLLSGQSFKKEKRLEMIATYFHALIQERRNYIPQGWNKFYEFNYGDYKSGLNIIQSISSSYGKNWDMLYGLMLDTIYGGRIDNDVDRKLLDVYLHVYFNDDMESGKTPIFKNLKIQQIDQIIQKLPNIDNPDLYNLPMGIDKALLRIKAKELVQNLKIATLTSDSSTKFSREEWNKTIGPVFTIWKGLQKIIGEGKLKRLGEEKLKSVDPIESFVFGQYNEAILNYGLIKNALQKLEGVLFGNDILTTEIEELGKTMRRGETPGKWRKIWEGPDLLTEWLKIFVNKLSNLEKWVELTQSNKLLTQELDLSQVYRPEIFLNALKQRAGRERKIPTNQLKIKASFSKPTGQYFVMIRNLILQGCSFSKDSIAQPKSDAEFQEIPVIYIFYNEKQSGKSDYYLPFYTDITRSTLLSMLPMTSSGSREKLVLASAALLLKDM